MTGNLLSERIRKWAARFAQREDQVAIVLSLVVGALVGLVVGAIAKFLVPGKQGGGIIITALLGVVGSLLGTWGGQQLGIVSMQSGTHWIASIVGAIVVVFVYSLITKKS